MQAGEFRNAKVRRMGRPLKEAVPLDGQVVVRVSAATKAEYERLAARLGVKPGELMREALEAALVPRLARRGRWGVWRWLRRSPGRSAALRAS